MIGNVHSPYKYAPVPALTGQLDAEETGLLHTSANMNLVSREYMT